MARLQAVGCLTWTFTEQPRRVRILLAVYQEKRAEALSLQRRFGGQVRAVEVSEWIGPKETPPTRIGRWIEIVHQAVVAKKKSGDVPRLHIPHGLAFGSGDHATTGLLLRELARRGDWSGKRVLDLGTGSGVLALAVRLFGAREIVATDFDSQAIRTARENEELNFSKPSIRWRCADVKKWRSSARYDLVLANLFSGILIEAAPQIAASVAVGGELWQSGVLRVQEKDVVKAYRAEGLRLKQVVSRGKWIWLQWGKAA